MSDIDDIVKVSVFTESQVIAEPNFGLPILVGYHTQWPERVRPYSGDILTELTNDGFAAGSQVFKMASALLGQEPKVPEILVGRRALAPTQVVKFTPPDAVVGKTYTVTVGPGGGVASYLAGSGDDATDICTGLKADIDAFNLDITVTIVSGVLVCTADDAGELFTYTSHNLLAEDTTTDPGLATDLNAIFSENDDGYCVLGDWQSKAQILAAAANIQPRVKLYIGDVSDNNASNGGVTTDTMSALAELSYSRTGTLYSQAVGVYQGSGWAGKMLTQNPGSDTWMFKTLAGVPVDKLTGAQIAAIAAKKGNYYTRRGGVAMTQEGWAASGKFLDETRFLDWYTSRLQINTFSQFINSSKVPCTENGLVKIEGAIRLANAEGADAGGIDDQRAITVSVPRITAIPVNDRKARKVKGIKIGFFLQGAIHRTEIEVTASV